MAILLLMRPLIAAGFIFILLAQGWPDTPPAGVAGYPGATLDNNPEPVGTYVLGCTACLGPNQDIQTDCYELVSQRGRCSEMATEERAEWTALANPPTLTPVQCDRYIRESLKTFIPMGCEDLATAWSIDDANWHATVQAVRSATPTPEEEN